MDFITAEISQAIGYVEDTRAPQGDDSIRRKAFDECIAIAKRFGGACPGHVQMRMYAALEAARDATPTEKVK